MLQVAQDYRTGTVQVVEVPAPGLRAGGVLVRTAASLISTGTERGKVELARQSLVAKARQRPEAVRQVIETVRSEGLSGAYRRVTHRLDQLSPLGYSAAGTVIEVGAGVTAFRPGDRVAIGGGGYANHAEMVWVPKNLVARIPEGVDFASASFATVGSISLHAFRLSGCGLNDTVAVVGLGLIGQLAARLALAAGCKVVACDLDDHRAALAQAAGARSCHPADLVAAVQAVSSGVGADAVLVAAASDSSSPMELAIEAARDRAKVVAVGAVQMTLPREPLFRKELSVVVSRSYGPGRYDRRYEEDGIDYPVSYVKWTEGRNLTAILELLANGRLEVSSLISARHPVAEAPAAFERLLTGDSTTIGVVLEYPARNEVSTVHALVPRPGAEQQTASASKVQSPKVGLIGAGTFASNVLVPAFLKCGARLMSVTSASGLSAHDAVRRSGFQRALPSASAVIEDTEVDVVVIATPHNLHAELTIEALAAGKAVFVEKPLALTMDEVNRLSTEIDQDARLFVGFNRRFSPHTEIVSSWFRGRGASAMLNVRVNAGFIPPDSWIHDISVGGGRLLGEGCHFVDLACALLGAEPVAVRCVSVGTDDPYASLLDNYVITLEFADGSLATILYTAKGSRRQEKERIEVFSDGRSAVVDNFNRTTLYGPRKAKTHRQWSAKGHQEEVNAFLGALRDGKPMPVSTAELLRTAHVTILAMDSLRSGGDRVVVSG